MHLVMKQLLRWLYLTWFGSIIYMYYLVSIVYMGSIIVKFTIKSLHFQFYSEVQWDRKGNQNKRNNK